MTRHRLLALPLAAMAICSGCGDEQSASSSGGSQVVQQTPEEGHLWDTTDPDAAIVPLGLIAIFLASLFLLVFVVRRPTGARPRSRSRPPRGRGR